MHRNTIVALLGLSLSPFALAADWPQFAGPDRTNVSPSKYRRSVATRMGVRTQVMVTSVSAAGHG